MFGVSGSPVLIFSVACIRNLGIFTSDISTVLLAKKAIPNKPSAGLA